MCVNRCANISTLLLRLKGLVLVFFRLARRHWQSLYASHHTHRGSDSHGRRTLAFWEEAKALTRGRLFVGPAPPPAVPFPSSVSAPPRRPQARSITPHCGGLHVAGCTCGSRMRGASTRCQFAGKIAYKLRCVPMPSMSRYEPDRTTEIRHLRALLPPALLA
jgi:hypothetical protein